MNMLGIGESSRGPAAPGHCIPPGGSCTMQPDRPAAVRARGPIPGACRMNLLLIDDEAGLRRTLRLALESMGHRAAEAGSAAQALERLAGDRFDLAFLDLRLGGESGLDVL